MAVKIGVYEDELDRGRVMGFLRRLYIETGGLENWLPPRFENNSRDMDHGIRLWWVDDVLVGFVIPENSLVYFIQLDPSFIWLYSDMVKWIVDYSRSVWGGVLGIIEMEDQSERIQILYDHGFKRGGIYGIFRVRDPDNAIPGFRFPDGFRFRSVTPGDFDELASCIRQVFGHGEWFDRGVLETLSSASFYDPDLDLVVRNDEGKIVSFCTFRYDAPTGLTELEPMGTLSKYRNMGIGRALICEGLRRLEKYDPSLIYIGGAANTPAANRLYELTGFNQRYDLIRWEKTLI